MHVTTHHDDWTDSDTLEIEVRGHDDYAGRYFLTVYEDGNTVCERAGVDIQTDEMAEIINAVSGEMDTEHVELAFELLAEMDDESSDDDANDSEAAETADDSKEPVEETAVAGTTFRDGDRLVREGDELHVFVFEGELSLQDGPTAPRRADRQWVESLFDAGYELERGA